MEQEKSTVISGSGKDSDTSGSAANAVVAEDAIVISDEDYATLAQATAIEQGKKIRCFDIREAIEAQKKHLEQVQASIQDAEQLLVTAEDELAGARRELRAVFQSIFEPLGLGDKHVSVTQESPHVVTVVEQAQ